MVRKESEILGGNKRPQLPWQLTLGPLQALIVCGAALGCIVGTFYLGFFSGRKSGFETARIASRAEVAKMPVPEDFIDEREPDPSQVYSELSESHRERTKPTVVVGEDKVAVEADSIPEKEDLSKPIEALSKEKNLSGGKKTLGELLDQRVQEVRATVTPTPKVQSTNTSSVKATVAPTTPPRVTPTRTPKVQPSATPTASQRADQQGDLRQVVPEGWFAQVAAPKKMSEAQEVANKLKKAGFRVVIENADVRGETFYRIIVGPEQSRVQAERLVEQLSRESVVSGKPFVRRVR